MSGCKPKRKNALTPSMLNRKIFIQSKISVLNEESIPVPTWTTVMTLFAFREPLRGIEYFQAAAETSEKLVRYKIRYRTGITAAMRIVDGKRTVNVYETINSQAVLVDSYEVDRVYQIITPLDDVYGDRTETHIMALEYEDG
jgi:SPP1 family predicted phage head-tail adaptor